jgi:hypothetical protein
MYLILLLLKNIFILKLLILAITVDDEYQLQKLREMLIELYPINSFIFSFALLNLRCEHENSQMND